VTTSVGAVVRHRGVLGVLIQRDLAVKYQSSILGYFWSLIEPLTLGAIYWFVFGVLFDTRQAFANSGANYTLFILSGIFAWQWFSTSLSESTTALTQQARVITTIKMPRELFPIGKVAGRFAEFLAGLPILIGAALLFHGDFSWRTPTAIIIAVILQFTLLTGLALMLSAVNVMLRDVERFIRLAQRILFYCAPIIYPLQKVQETTHLPGWAKTVYELNPMVGIFELQHAAWFAQSWDDAIRLLPVSAAGSLLILFLGWWVLRRLEPSILKEL
jgi:ABC-2 type transport system permease protein